MEDTKIFYNIQIPSYLASGISLMDDYQTEELRRELAGDIYESYARADKTIIDEMISLGISINFRYYTNNVKSPIYTISMPATYIKRIGTR